MTWKAAPAPPITVCSLSYGVRVRSTGVGGLPSSRYNSVAHRDHDVLVDQNGCQSKCLRYVWLSYGPTRLSAVAEPLAGLLVCRRTGVKPTRLGGVQDETLLKRISATYR